MRQELVQLQSALKLKKPVLQHQNNILVEKNNDLIVQLASLGSIENVKQGSGLKVVSKAVDAWLDVSDEKLDAYKNELEDKISEAKDRIKALEKRLSNKPYVDNAPKQVVSQTKDELTQTKTTLNKLQSESKKLD